MASRTPTQADRAQDVVGLDAGLRHEVVQDQTVESQHELGAFDVPDRPLQCLLDPELTVTERMFVKHLIRFMVADPDVQRAAGVTPEQAATALRNLRRLG